MALGRTEPGPADKGPTYGLLGGFSNAVVLEDGLVQRVQQVRCPNDVPSVGRDFCYASAEHLVQNLELGQSRRQLLHYYCQSYRSVCQYKKSNSLAWENVYIPL